jgi:hypothetical protein
LRLAVIFLVELDRPEELQDPLLLPPSDELPQSFIHRGPLGAMATDLLGFLDELRVNS